MYGIINELARQGHEVVLVSNAHAHDHFHKSVKHIDLGYPFTRRDKRLFQGIVGVTPPLIAAKIYGKLFNSIKLIFESNGIFGKPVYFFEYLDNTIGYLLRKMGWVSAYYNDLHGMPTLEFKFRSANAVNTKERIELFAKYLLAVSVDNKIYGCADGYIFATEAMKNFFEKTYPGVKNGKKITLPYLVSENIEKSPVDARLLDTIRSKYGVENNHYVLLFAGGFKKTGGMTDLIEAVGKLREEYRNIKLLMIGDGPVLAECQSMVKEMGLESNIHFVGRTKYEELRTYQEVADLLVCPDKENTYSRLIIHVKYFDALASGKLVINGAFPPVLEVNPEDNLSVSFEPSNVDDLANKIAYCLKNKDTLEEKYKDNPRYVMDNFTYKSFLSKNKINWF